MPPSQWTVDNRGHVVRAIDALRRMAESAAEKAAILQDKLDGVDAILAAEGQGPSFATPPESGLAADAEDAAL